MADEVDPVETLRCRCERLHDSGLHDAALDCKRQLHDLEHPDEDKQWFGP